MIEQLKVFANSVLYKDSSGPGGSSFLGLTAGSITTLASTGTDNCYEG